MTKAYISNVDQPVCRSLGRLLAYTVVGCRKNPEEDSDFAETPTPTMSNLPCYEVIGSLSPKKADDLQDDEIIDVSPFNTSATMLNQLLATSGAAEGKPSQEPTPAEEPTQRSVKNLNVVNSSAPKRIVATKKGLLNLPDLYPEKKRQKPSWIQSLVPKENRDVIKAAILEADVIVYDITDDYEEAAWALEVLAENAAAFAEKSKTFIAVSSVLSWSKTKYESDDADAVLTEEEYRRRKPHPNYKSQTEVEKAVIKLGKEGPFKCYVVVPGLIYHPGDSIFHQYFKAAWQGAPQLICYGEGNNNLPLVHLTDLTNILVEVIEMLPEKKYIFAVDDSKLTLYQVIKTISEGLGTGKVIKMSREQALINKKLSQMDIDLLQTNLRMDPQTIKEMSFEWKYEAGFIENAPSLVAEYRVHRRLTPLKILIHGPPFSGKTHYAHKLCAQYELHHIDAQKVAEEGYAALEKRLNEQTAEEDEEEIEALKEKLVELRETLKTNNNKFMDDQILTFVREKIRSMPCRNQGYVLDGFPTTIEEANTLFQPADDDEASDDKAGPVDKATFPQFVISLDLSDEAIKERVMALPESETANTRNSEEALIARLEKFRQTNTDEVSVLNFFDEREVHPLIVSTETNTSEMVFNILQKKIGKPHNYGPSEEQLIEMKKRQVEEKQRQEALAEQERVLREKEESQRQSKAQAEWNQRLEEVRKQEFEMLSAQSAPLRNYLVHNVMPTLTSALIEVCKVRPEDPVDYLAEYLFKHNENNNRIVSP